MNSTNTYRWLFFDADGTLFDYDMAEAKALEATFRDFDFPFLPATAEAYRVINKQVWLDFEHGRITSAQLRTIRFERLFEAVQLHASADVFSQGYLKNLAAASDLMDGAAELIHQLRRRYRLAIITNGLSDVQHPRLAGSGIADCFDFVGVSEDLKAAKPDPLFFERVFAHTGSPEKETVLVIGDSLTSDIQGGLNFGLDTCWFNPSGLPADPRFPAKFEIRHLNELPALLESPE